MAIDAKKLTYEDFLKLPETTRRFEVVDGELLYMSPSPTPQHQRVSRNLFRLLDGFVTGQAVGEVLYAPIDVLVQREPLRTRQPDLLYVSTERQSIIGSQHIEAGPDLVVEILSSGNARVEMEAKLEDYWSLDVQECWRVSPEGRTVEVLQHTTSGFARTGLYGVGDTLISSVLPDLRINVANIW
jgi:Uma2 family endonuclease